MENDGFQGEPQLQKVTKTDDPNDIIVEAKPSTTENTVTVKYVSDNSKTHGNTCFVVVILTLTLSGAVIAGALCNYFLSHGDPPQPTLPPCQSNTESSMRHVRSLGGNGGGAAAPRSFNKFRPGMLEPVPARLEGDKSKPVPAFRQDVCLTKPCVVAAGRMLENMNEDINPCDDFYQYACGGWQRKTPITPDKPHRSVLNQLADSNAYLLKSVMENSEASVRSEIEKKSLQLYAACMDKETRDEIGVTPLVEMVASHGGWNPSSTNIESTLARLITHYATPTLFDFSVGADEFDSSRKIFKLDQPTMYLPDRRVYVHGDSDPIVVNYLEFMTTVLGELGLEQSSLDNFVDDVWRFEVELAKILVPVSTRRDNQVYNKMSVRELQTISTQINWLNIINDLAAPNVIHEYEVVMVYNADYMTALSTLISNSDPRTVHNYMLWRLVASYSKLTSSKMHAAHVRMESAVTGASVPPEEWRVCAQIVSSQLGMPVGAMFVRKLVGTNQKQKVVDIVNNVKTAFRETLLHHVDWMSPETIRAAVEKVDAMGENIDYPNFILNPEELDRRYNGLVLDQASYFQSIVNSVRFDYNNMMTTFSEPVNKQEWVSPPQQPNVFYKDSTNTLTVLAAMLQSPIFDSESPEVLNYAGIGFIIAQELLHGFDTNGRLYNKYGSIAPWWSEKSARAYDRQNECVVEQFGNYEVNGIDMKINGTLTKRENIADLGAIKYAFNAYQSTLNQEPMLPAVQKTNEQVFFIAFAQNWCSNLSDERAKSQILLDSYSPEKFRVIGALSQYEEFSRAFNCPMGSTMNPRDKCTVW